MTAAEALAGFGEALTYDAVPPEVAHRAKLGLLDVVGCALAASAAGAGTQAQALVLDEQGAGPAELWDTGTGTTPSGAALANGMLGHALDFDDTHPAAMIHVSTVVAPAAVAVGQARGATGRDLVVALVAGTEATTRLGLATPGAFHERGLHPTSVCGVFGGALAVAGLLGLDRAQTTAALGIAGSTASGLFEFLADGSATKPFHAGWAAHASVVAAGMARLGATGPASVLEGRFGLFRAVLGQEADEALREQVADLGERWETLAMAIKPYPACHLTHAAMDGAQQLHRRGLRAEDVASVQLRVPEAAVGIVLEPAARKARPDTPYEAKFSLPFSVAAMLVDGAVDLDSYGADRLGDERVLDLAGRVTYTVVPADGRGPFFTELTVQRADGATDTVDVPHPSGTPEAPLDTDAVVRKFTANAVGVLGDAATDVAEAILAIDDPARAGAGLLPLRAAAGARG
ncbi:MmgE/PrpD family protein [Baekduia soli]|uniref:MmgE/PrpD family protein n=1 Tax=Baekduia soli TaxID=496014 RepID=A0A5B8U321_9ACTN|nr:MmgE/PrpD family protein [Baekduia soli]QEC47383.1 MmgE/PrpD family protein [Baekduia soli]